MYKRSKKRAPIRPDRLKLTLLALPFVVFVFLFSYVPLLGWGLAFFDYKPGLSLDKIRFVGFKYFQLMFFYKEDILNALLNTLVLSFHGGVGAAHRFRHSADGAAAQPDAEGHSDGSDPAAFRQLDHCVRPLLRPFFQQRNGEPDADDAGAGG